ncbi:hypothetical protein BABINDRAFT_163712 [Babjeviella inositovora NRRL Y-12698]|uniref:Mitogen-activated protein kinase n=1 Tax=Babjeviella inositovora NRRL Y-12698 TaxID=984486 RepID=A0A1E3QJN4_9ASCO|nr:uncharacterized protein BABINDRAFT_163712 [Babjeviella inositovora NRRL Y-12698]ODQ77207.1 hypothetical protein BABINDRAFT_163712 [Babjeviella inositovora NRRL Y-12698]
MAAIHPVPNNMPTPHSKAHRKITFNISNQFLVQRIIGEGAYGIVCLANYKPTNTKVAIKKVEPFERHLFCLRTLREIMLLKKFRKHENIVSLYDIQKPQSYQQFTEVYLVQEYMQTDMHQAIQTQTLTDDHIQYFIYQSLRGLKYIHSAGVIHRDLKPSNLLLNSNCDLKICDFGLARFEQSLHQQDPDERINMMTEYVATRWYRAPEIMLSSSQYTTAIDIWSMGCILAELFMAAPLFPGKDYRHQLLLIFELLGTPSSDDMLSVRSKRAREYIRTLPQFPRVNLRAKFSFANPLGLDLLEKLLIFDPTKRIKVTEALEHPYLAAYHDSNDEPTCEVADQAQFLFDNHKDQLTCYELKQMLYKEVLSYRFH